MQLELPLEDRKPSVWPMCDIAESAACFRLSRRQFSPLAHVPPCSLRAIIPYFACAHIMRFALFLETRFQPGVLQIAIGLSALLCIWIILLLVYSLE